MVHNLLIRIQARLQDEEGQALAEYGLILDPDAPTVPRLSARLDASQEIVLPLPTQSDDEVSASSAVLDRLMPSQDPDLVSLSSDEGILFMNSDEGSIMDSQDVEFLDSQDDAMDGPLKMDDLM